MADEIKNTPGSITQPADNNNERISEISNVTRAIANMQKQVDQQLSEIQKETGNAEAISQVQNSMTKVLNKMSATVGEIGKGFGKISIDVAKSGKDVISQYGRAISQDISYNKQNIVAMALSKSTPIYGYFISKFMETDIWKSATARMKANIGSALSSVGSKLKSAIGGLRRGKKNENESLSKQARSVKVPHMAKGGVVQKTGLAKLHAAEVVMPADKLLSRIDEQISATKVMAKTVQRGQLHSIAKMNTYVGSLEEYQKQGVVKGFFRALKDVQTQYEEPAQQRMLRALLSIQDVLGGQIGTWRQVWQKMLIQNPSFRHMVVVGNILRKTLAAPFTPIYKFFKVRGGYEGHLSHSKSPLSAVAENVGVLYTGSMHRLDRITMYTKATAEATRDLASYITGNTYSSIEGIKTGRWSFFGGARGLINWATKWSIKGAGRLAALGMPEEDKKQIIERADELAAAMTKKRDLRFWRKGSMGGQQDILAGGLGEVKPEEKAMSAMAQVFSNKHILSGIDKEGALPVIQITPKKIKSIEDKKWSLQKKEFNLSKHAVEIAKDNYKENKSANRRTKRKSLFGFLSGGFGAVKSLLGSFMGFLPMIAGLFGFGSLGKGGLFGGFVNILRQAFLGKRGIKGKGGILGALGRKAARFLKGIKLKFPRGFLRKIGPALLRSSSSMIGMAGRIAGRIGGLFSAGGPIISSLGPALAVAAAGVIGWKIGKTIDKFLGLSKRFIAKQDEYDKQANNLRAIVEASKKEESKKAQLGNKEGFENYFKIKATAAMAGGDVYGDSLGFFGSRHMVMVRAAQEQYMREHINEYMNYTPETLRKARLEFIKKRAHKKAMGTDPRLYGRLREEHFVKFLKSNVRELSAEEKALEFQKYKEKRRMINLSKMASKLYGVKDSISGLYAGTRDVARQKVTEAVVTTQALKKKMENQASETWKATQESAKKIGDAVNQGTVIVSNTINNAATTTMNGARELGVWGKDQLNEALIRGKVDGD